MSLLQRPFCDDSNSSLRRAIALRKFNQSQANAILNEDPVEIQKRVQREFVVVSTGPGLKTALRHQALPNLDLRGWWLLRSTRKKFVKTPELPHLLCSHLHQKEKVQTS